MSDVYPDFRWHISIFLEPPREWGDWVVATNVTMAVITAIMACDQQEGELIHSIHVGPPRALT